MVSVPQIPSLALRFARVAAFRLHGLLDPQILGNVEIG